MYAWFNSIIVLKYVQQYVPLILSHVHIHVHIYLVTYFSFTVYRSLSSPLSTRSLRSYLLVSSTLRTGPL